MLANPVLRTSLSFPRMILLPFEPITSAIISIGLLVPILHPLYKLIMNIIWFPFYCYMKFTGSIYRKVWMFRPIMAIITIPLLIVLDVFILIMPGTSKRDKFEKASIIDSWPCKSESKMPDSSNGQCIPINEKARSYFIDVSSRGRSRVIHCSLCGDMVKADWTQCPRCGENLDAVLPLPSTQHSRAVMNEREASQRWADALSEKAMTSIRECALCGDMVRADWRTCPRCGELLRQIDSFSVLVS